jgi:hypothetical protein
MALIIAGFARPFVTLNPLEAAAASGAREVVIMLDRSASMGYGNHWQRAQDEARQIVRGLSGDDRATLVLFDQNVEETVRATSSKGELEAAIGNAAVTSNATRYAPVLREAQSLLSRSDRGRREAYLITDFQKTGWERQEDIRLPEGAVITPVSVAELETSSLSVSNVAIARTSFSNEERATITASLVNRSATAVTNQPVQLEIDGRVVATRQVTIPAQASGSVTYDALTVSEANMQGAIKAGTDALAKDNVFYFGLSPSRSVSVLLLESDGAPRNTSLYLTTVLRLSKTPPFNVEVVPLSRVGANHFQNRSVVIVNDTNSLPTAAETLIREFVQRGGGALFVLGARNPVARDSPMLPGTLGSTVDRATARGGSLGYVDYSHPIFDDFKDPRNGNFANIRFHRYRGLAAGASDHVLARFDDGATAMAERQVGAGRVIALTSTVDNDWNNAPQHPMFLPLVHETVGYLAQYAEPEPWQTVGRMFDLSAAVASIVREGQAASTAIGEGGPTGVVVTPSESQVTLGRGGVPALELSEQGFYAVRLPGTGGRRPFAVAVNIDPRESELSALAPAEFLAAVTGGGTVAAGQALEQPVLTPVAMEKKQSFWWYLMVGGLAALLAEAALSNWQSRRGTVPGLTRA